MVLLRKLRNSIFLLNCEEERTFFIEGVELEVFVPKKSERKNEVFIPDGWIGKVVEHVCLSSLMQVDWNISLNSSQESTNNNVSTNKMSINEQGVSPNNIFQVVISPNKIMNEVSSIPVVTSQRCNIISVNKQNSNNIMKIKCSNKLSEASLLPMILECNIRSLRPKLDSLAAEFNNLGVGIGFISEIWENFYDLTLLKKAELFFEMCGIQYFS